MTEHRRPTGAGRRVAAWLLHASETSYRVQAVAMAVLTAMTVALAAWGWTIYADQHPDADLDLFAMVSGTWGLFAPSGSIEPVPGPLAWARALGPLVSSAVVLRILLELAAPRLRSFLARSSTGHVVVVAPHDVGDPTVRAALDAGHAVVHVASDDASTGRRRPAASRRLLHVSDDGTDAGWIVDTNAKAARRVVIAGGSEATVLGRLAACGERGVPSEGSTLQIELESPVLAVAAAIDRAAADPAADVEIVSPSSARALHAGQRILDEIARSMGFSDARRAPDEQDVIDEWERRYAELGLAAHRDIPVVAVVGAGATAQLIAVHLSTGLQTLRSLISHSPFELVVVDAAPERVAGQQPERLPRLDAASLAAWQPARPLVAVVDDDDPGRNLRRAAELASTGRRGVVWTTGESTDVALAGGFGRAELRVLSHHELEVAGALIDVLTRVVLERRTDLARRRGVGADTDVPLDGTWTVQQVRAAVRLLHAAGWRIVPAVGATSTPIPAGLPPLLGGALREPPIEMDDPDALLPLMVRVGLSVLPPSPAPPGARTTTNEVGTP